MPIEPSSIQRDRMLSLNQTNLVLVQFSAIKDQSALDDFLSISRKITIEEGGQNQFQLKIDQVLAGGELPYQIITVDRYKKSDSLLMAFEKTRSIRQETIADIYGFIVKPNNWIPQITKRLGTLSPPLSRWLATTTEKPLTGFSDRANPEIEPTPETVTTMRQGNQDNAFYMMNLNKYKSQGSLMKQGRLTGKSAYDMYSARIIPYLVSVGGFPEMIGPITCNYIGDNKNRLKDSWSDFALVYYPSRSHFLRLMTNTPRGAADYRRTGLERAVLMPCSTIKN